MKYAKVNFILFALLVATGFSCSKKIDEAYANPNADTRLPPEKVLPYIVNSMFANMNGHGAAHDARYIGQYVQNWFYAGVGGVYERMGYTNSAADVGQSMWRSHYYDIGQNNVKMIQWAIDEKKWDYAGAGKAVFAWSWLTLTDIYGDVILDDAFNTALYTFRYNTQDQVYNYVRQLCFEALDYLGRTGDNTGKLAEGDAYFYNGDVNKWKKFVYGMLARYYNHQSNKANYKPDSVIYYCNLSLSTNADNAMVSYVGTINQNMNYYGPQRNNFGLGSTLSPTAIRQSAFIADLMTGQNTTFTGVNDPRAFYMLRLNTNGTYKGLSLAKGQQVLAANDRPESFHAASQATGIVTTAGSDANCRFIFRNTSPTPVFTASEVQFMKAEAAYRKGDKLTAYNAYKEGIRLHFDMLMNTYSVNVPSGNLITGSIRDAYLANPAVVPVSFTDLRLSQIMLQKYIALWGHGVTETWVDMRRFHYTDSDPTGAYAGQVYTNFAPPSGVDLFTPDNGGKLVYRIRPRFNSEYVWNINELIRIGADQLDYHTKRMWFSEP